MQIEKTCFISYRHETGNYRALAVWQFLTHHGYDVFIDFDTLGSGSFASYIPNQIGARAHFLVILTPSALERCVNPNDWLRLEIETAIENKRNIIPLLFDDFDFKKAKRYLTGKLVSLSEYNGLEIPSQLSYFSSAMERLTNKFLNIPLNAVLHPVSEYDKIIVQEKIAIASQKADVTEIEFRVPSHIEQALITFNSGNYRKAISALNDVLKLSPDSFTPHLYAMRGQSYMQVGEFNKATADYQKALDMYEQKISEKPNNAFIYLERASLYHAMRAFDNSIEEYNKVLELESDNPFAHAGIADIYRQRQNYDGAILEYNKSIDSNPEFAHHYSGRGIVYAAKGLYERAIEDYDKAITLYDKEPMFYYNRGNAYRLMGINDDAIKDYDEAIRLDKKYAKAFNNRGYAYFLKGEYKRAIEDYDRALLINPNYELAKINRFNAKNARRNEKS